MHKNLEPLDFNYGTSEKGVLEPLAILQEASERIYNRVYGMAGTDAAGGDYGRGAGGDISKAIDMAAEGAVLEYLREMQFSCTILGEECGRVEIHGGGPYIVMDAIDGTTNAVRGFPFYCSSLAYAEGYSLGEITAGVIKNLHTGRTYWATRGGGAFADGSRIRASRGDYDYTILGLNLSGTTPEMLQGVQSLTDSAHIRHMGANALEMAVFAEGLMDAFVDMRGKIRIQDVAAGYLLVKEAGGILLDQNMKPLDADLGYDTRVSFVAAADEDIAGHIASKINGALGGI